MEGLVAGKVPAKKGMDKEVSATTVDEAIRLTGSGTFHWLLVVATGMCPASAVFEIVSPSYLLSPAAWATCDLHMEAGDKNLLSAIVFIGMLTGTHFWGAAADSWGRLPLLRITLLGDGVMGVISALLPDKRLFIAARFLNGFLVAGPTSTAMAYLGEFHSEKTRGKAMLILGLFPGGATLVVAALAYLVLPLPIAWHLPWLDTFRSWRLFVLLNAMPALLTGLTFLWFPESPRFLLSTGRPEEALQSLRTAYALNKGRDKEFPVKALVCPVDGARRGGSIDRLASMVRQTVALFRLENLRNTVLMDVILFVVLLSANGLLVWMPEIFNRMATFSERFPDRPATACVAIQGLMHLSANASSLLPNQTHPEACGGVLQDAMFINTGIIGVANIVVGLLAAVAIEWLGKRCLLICSLVTAGVCGVLMTVVPTSVALLALACGLIGLTNSCISIVVSLGVENYPTVLRATAVSLGMLAGRSGSMSGSLIFGTLLGTQCSAAFWGLGALLGVSAVLAFLMPRRGVYAA